MSSLEQYADQGNEFVTARDTKLPILKILYANSPVLDESDGKFNDKARQGDIYNEITGSLYKGKEGIKVIPVALSLRKGPSLQWLGLSAADVEHAQAMGSNLADA